MNKLLMVPVGIIVMIIGVKTLVWIRSGHLFDFLVLLFIITSLFGILMLTSYAIGESKTWSK